MQFGLACSTMACLAFALSLCLRWLVLLSVTAVESAAKALEVLGVNEAQHPGVSNNVSLSIDLRP